MSAFCLNGIANITFNNKDDEVRFNQLKEQFKGSDDAAYQMLVREKSGEVISPDSILLNRDSQLIEDTLSQLEIKNDKDLTRLKGVVDKQITSLTSRIKDLKKSANNLKGNDKTDRQNTVEKLEDLLQELDTLETREQFIAIIDYTQAELGRTEKWLEGGEKGFNPDKEVHRDTLLAIKRQLDTYAGLNVPQYAAKHSDLKGKIEDINIKYQNITQELKERSIDVLVKMHKDYSTNSKYKDEDAIRDYLRESNDIDGLQALFIDLDSSTDTTLGIIGKIYAEKREEVSDMVNEATTKIFAAGKKLLDAGYEDQDFMLAKDSAGNKTANIIQRLSDDWHTKLSEIFSLTDSLEVDDNGRKKKREYIKKEASLLSEDEKRHNIELAADKKSIAAFLRPEQWDKKTRSLVDGENKKYTDEFKAARDTYEIYDEGGWVKAEGVSDDAYNKYLKRYYGPKITAYRLMLDADKQPTGEVEEYETRFPKDMYTEVQSKWNSKDYEAIQANPDQKEFYDFYVQTYKELMDKLPADISKRMDGKVLRIKDDFMEQLASKKTSMIKTILSKIKQLILPDIITNGRQLGEDGRPVNDLAIFYVGDLKSEKRIAQLEAQIEQLAGKTDTDSKKVLAKLKNSLLIENNKLEPNQVEYDLVKSLTQGISMATNYDVMKSVESTFLLVQEHLHEKDYYAGLDKFGDPITESSTGRKQLKEKGTSNVEKRLATWMRMVFYNNSQANNTQVAKMALLLKKYVSAVSVGGLAVFPAFNNIVTAEMSNVIEGFGGRFYKNKSYVRSSKLMAKHLSNPQWATHMFKQPGKYEEEKPYDLLTSLVEHYNFLEENADRASGLKQKQTVGQYIKSGNVLYALTEGGEYQAQVRSALAYLDNKLVDVSEDFEYTNFEGEKVTTKDKKISLLDAYIFDEATNKLSLREGISFDAKNKRTTTGEIRNMNKTIHGNHSSVDRVPMQENWYGELAFQFKRWMPNAIRSRFSEGYYDESVGLEMRGRYWAIQSMLQNMTDIKSLFNKEAYNKLSDLEQANMRKNAVEALMWATALALYVIFDAVREGLPPDDEKTRAALNFLKQQAHRTRGEIDFFINPIEWYKQTKSPVAGFRIFGEVAEFISALTGVPFYAIQGKTEKLIYNKGINKGTLKVVKEGRDLLPVLKQIGQFKQLDVTGDFFIR